MRVRPRQKQRIVTPRARRDFFGRWFGLVMGSASLVGAYWLTPSRPAFLLAQALALLSFGLMQDYLPRELKWLPPLLALVAIVAALVGYFLGVL